MIDPIRELRIRAQKLHRAAREGDQRSLARVPGTSRDDVQRKDCLAAIAREHGLRSWAHALRVLGGDPTEPDLGTLLYPGSDAPYPNHWFARYDEARAQLDAHGGWLLGYREQFVVVEAPFIEALGLDPGDPDWARIGRDWARPLDRAARGRLYARLIESAPVER